MAPEPTFDAGRIASLPARLIRIHLLGLLLPAVNEPRWLLLEKDVKRTQQPHRRFCDLTRPLAVVGWVSAIGRCIRFP
jgi:hypothetical protein